MKTGDDFRREFPEAEESFKLAINDALNDEIEKVYSTNPKLRAAILLAAVLLLLTSLAVAATIERWNVKNFTERSQFANLSKDALKALAAGFEDHVIENPYAQLVVTEAVYDGMATYILIEAMPKLEGAFIIPSHLYERNQAYSYGSGYPKDMSIQQYAAQLGYKMVLSLQCFGNETTAHYYDSAINEDGTFSMMIWSYVRPEYRNQPELTMNMCIPVAKDGVQFDELTSSFTIPLAGEIQRAKNVEGESVTFENAGIKIKGVEAIRTPMSTYIIILYDITEKKRYNEYKVYGELRFEDENGNTIPKGAQPLSFWVDSAGQQMGDNTYYITNRLFDKMPTHITIGEKDGSRSDGWTDGKTYTFHLE